MNSRSVIVRREQLRAIENQCDRFEACWRDGSRPGLASYLAEMPAELQTEAFAELLEIEVAYRRLDGEFPEPEEYQYSFERYAPIIERVLTRSDATRTDDDLFEVPPVIPGLRFIRKLGQGGMGVVYLAEQVDLRRFVAVKMLRSGSAANVAERSRFRTEVEAVASLKHPGIVQVYQVGNVDGKPYCILEYVEGGSLRDYLGGRPQPPVLSADLMRRLALALAHAHQLGFIHRDLKPANILLEFVGRPARSTSETIAQQLDTTRVVPSVIPETTGTTSISNRETIPQIGDAQPTAVPVTGDLSSHESEYDRGQTWNCEFSPKITDFGLARRIESVDGGQTQSGVILGTLNYLSPEQASGSSRSSGPTTDIYSLGTILFEMLTGQTPHEGVDCLEKLHVIRTREAISPRSLRPEIPRDLETICLKCLNLEPAKRYQTARELADDLSSFLANKSIRARAIGPLEKLWRWYRKEQKVAHLGIAILLVSIAGVLATTFFWNRSRYQANLAFDQQVSRVEQDIEFINRQEFTFVPRMDEMRRQFLERLADQCIVLLGERSEDTSLRRKIALVRHQLGLIYGFLGKYPEAITEVSKAVEIQNEIAASDRFVSGDHQRLALIRHDLGNILQTVGRFDEAQSLFAKAIADFQKELELPEDSRGLGDVFRSLGWSQIQTGQTQAGWKHLQRALELHRLAVELDDSTDSQLTLSITETQLASCLLDRSQLSEAKELLDAAIVRLESLIVNEQSPVVRLRLTQALTARAKALELDGRQGDGEANLVRAYETIQKLAVDFPHRPDYQMETSFSLQNVARYNDRIAGDGAGEKRGSEVDINIEISPLERRLREAMLWQENVARDFPAVVENKRRLARTKNELATWLADKSTYLTDPQQADQALQESEAIHRACVQILEQLVHDFPDIIQFQNDLSRSDLRYGVALNLLNRTTEAETRYRRSVELQNQLAELHPEFTVHGSLLGALYNNLGVLADRRGELQLAESYFRKALEQGQRVLEKTPRHEIPRGQVVQFRDNLVDIMLRTDRYQDVPAELLQIQEIWPRELWNSEGIFGRCRQVAEAARQDPSLTEVNRSQFLLELEVLTCKLIERSLEVSDPSFRDISHILNSWPGFDHVRHREEFKSIRKRFE